MANSIDDAIRTHHNLANLFVVELWHYSPKLRELSERFGVRDKKPAKFKRAIRRINRNITNDVAEVFASSR